MKKNLLKLGRITLSISLVFLFTGIVGFNYFSADSIKGSASSDQDLFTIIIQFSIFLVLVSIACFYFAFIQKNTKKY